MSGGHFNYDQYRIHNIIDSIEIEIESNNYDFPEHIIQKFKEGVYFLKIAEIYAQRIDWLISGDDNEDSFIKRLNDEISQIKIEEG